MSAGTVLDESGFDASDVELSVHSEKQGECGVTGRAPSGCITARISSRCREWKAISDGPIMRLVNNDEELYENVDTPRKLR